MSLDPKIKKLLGINEQTKQTEQARYRLSYITTASQPVAPPTTPMEQPPRRQTTDDEIEMEYTNTFPSRWFR